MSFPFLHQSGVRWRVPIWQRQRTTSEVRTAPTPPDDSTIKTRWPDLMCLRRAVPGRAKAGWVPPRARRSGPRVCARPCLGARMRTRQRSRRRSLTPRHRLKLGHVFGRQPQPFPGTSISRTRTFGAHDATVPGRGVSQPRRDEDRVHPETRIRLRDVVDFGLNVILDALTRSILDHDTEFASDPKPNRMTECEDVG